MAKKKIVTEDNVVTIENQDNPSPIVNSEESAPLQYDGDDIVYDDKQVFVDDSDQLVTKDEQVVAKSVAKKKGLSSFGSMLKAASAKRKERNLKFKNDGENKS